MVWFRSFCAFLIPLFIVGFVAGQHINEFHYDNDGADGGEFIEVVLSDPPPANLSEYRIVLYNGADSLEYDSRSIDGITPTCLEGLCYYIWSKQPFVQNGPRDGIAFVKVTTVDTTVFDFISYEGTLIAKDGLASGEMSTDIGISEDSNTPVGWSLQKRMDGSWFAGPSTQGSVNPIELLSFEAKYIEKKNGVLLEWRTATEINNQYFEVQKSRDQSSFWSITTVAGAGNSAEIREYQFLDPEVVYGRVYYRLKQVDYNQSFKYSPVIVVQIHPQKRLSDLFPFLLNGKIHLPKLNFRHPIDLVVYDIMGRKLLSKSMVHTGDVIPVNAQMEGVVFYQLRSRGLQHSGRLVVMGR